MSCISRVLILAFATLLTIGLVGSTFHVGAQDKKDKKKEDAKDKKEDAKDKKDVAKDKKEVAKDKKDEKKEEKIEKKEPFKPDPAQSEFTYILKGEKDDKEKTFWVFGVAFGADGKTVAATYRDNTVHIWDIAAKKDIQTLKGNPTETKALLFAKGEILVSTGKWNKEKKAWEGEIKVWDKAGKSGKSLKGHSAPIEYLALSKDGKFLATASEDKTVIIWDLAAGKETQTLKGHTETVNSVSFSPDGKQAVTTSADKTVRVWDLAGPKEIALFKVEREVEIKDAKGKVSKQKELGREFTRAVFTSDGKNVIAGNLDGVIKIYDVEGKKELKELKAHEGVWALALSPDGTKLATGGYDQTIKIWNVADGKELKTIKAHLGTVTSISFSPNGESIASGSIDGTVKIWSVK